MTAVDEEPFIVRRLRLKAEREAAERAERGDMWSTPAAGADLPVDSSRGQNWVAAKVTASLDQLAALQPGERNHSLNAIAYSIGHYVPKWVDGQTVARQLYEAARACGLEHNESVATINSGLSKGKLEPRDPPVSDDDPFGAPVAVEDPADPFDDVEAPSVPAEPSQEDRLAAWHARKVAEYTADLRAREEAKRIYAAERAGLEFREPPSVLTLTEQLRQPREATRYAIESLLPVHGNALLTAQYKTGKTTFVTALLKAFADTEPFLGRYAVHPARGRVAVWNYELSQAQYDEWLEQAGIVNTDAVSVLHLRGFRLPLTAARVEDWCVSWLKDHDVAMWIADPFARASVGTDENSNTEVGVWLDTFDVIKARAGVSEGVLPTHTGRAEQEAGQERARGATRLDDWADVRWLLTRDDDGNRFFRATGRDVEIAEEKLTFDPATRGLTIGGGDRRWERMRALEESVVAFIRANPGATAGVIERGVEGKAEGIRSALRVALNGHRIRVEEGEKNARRHYAN